MRIAITFGFISFRLFGLRGLFFLLSGSVESVWQRHEDMDIGQWTSVQIVKNKSVDSKKVNICFQVVGINLEFVLNSWRLFVQFVCERALRARAMPSWKKRKHTCIKNHLHWISIEVNWLCLVHRSMKSKLATTCMITIAQRVRTRAHTLAHTRTQTDRHIDRNQMVWNWNEYVSVHSLV